MLSGAQRHRASSRGGEAVRRSRLVHAPRNTYEPCGEMQETLPASEELTEEPSIACA